MLPRVSKAKGTKQYAGKITVYLADFLSAAISGATPAASADLARYESARVSMTVASQAKHLPPSHGIRVTPSGRFPSDLTRPTDSLVLALFGYVHTAGPHACALYWRVYENLLRSWL